MPKKIKNKKNSFWAYLRYGSHITNKFLMLAPEFIIQKKFTPDFFSQTKIMSNLSWSSK